MAEFSFVFTDGRFLQLNDQKYLRSVAEDLLSNKQKELNEFIKNNEDMDIIELSSQHFSSDHNFSDFYSACKNKCHLMKASSV